MNQIGHTGSGSAAAVYELAKTQRKEHARTWLLAAIQLIPAVGGSLGTLLQEYLPNWKAERVKRFIEDLAQDFERVKEQVDAQAAQTEEYGLLTENVLRKVAQLSNADKEKLRAYRAILLNTVRPSAPEKMKHDHYLGLLDRLQEVHVFLLSLFYDPTAFAKAHAVSPFENLPATYERILEEFVRPFGLDTEFVQTVIADLQNFGIVARPAATVVNYSPKFANQPSAEQEIKSKLTKHGRAFAHFIALHD
jgi:hypothetical protein